MGSIAYGVRWVTDGLLRPLDSLPSAVALVVVSAITGVAMLGVVRIATRPAAVGRARDQMASAIYEIRLFMDQPRQVLSAQGRFFLSSASYLLNMVPALLVMAGPLGLLYLHLETRFGLAPLPVGEPLVVRIDLADSTDGDQLTITGDDAVAVTAPPVYDRPRQRLYVRVIVQRPGSASLQIQTPAATVDKRLVADPNARRVSPERLRGVSTLWAYGHESPVPNDSGIERITAPHPDRASSWLSLPWWAWWLLIATLAALLLKRPFRVVL